MRRIPKATQKLFKHWGSAGGHKRRKALSPAHRSLIASQAARARWKGETLSSVQSVRLKEVRWDEPVFIEEILAEGGLPAWRELYHRIVDFPFGETAEALEKVVHSVTLYGATHLWKSLLKNCRGGLDG